MPSTFSPSLRLELIGTGEQAGLWGVTTNNNLGDLLEQAISGSTSLDVTSGDITLTALNGVVDEARSAVLAVTGTPGTTRTITIPNVSKLYSVSNYSDSTLNIKTATGVAYAIPFSSIANIYCDGNNNIGGRTITDAAQVILNSQTPFTNVALSGTPTAPTAAPGTNTTQIATTAFVQTAVQSAVPAGVITMWSGSIVSIPSGWALCDGTGGTPDLRDRFVVGAGNTYAVGATGGANTVTLDLTQIPSHNHGGVTGGQSIGHTHTFSATTNTTGAHTHGLGVEVMYQAAGSGPFFTGNQTNIQYGIVTSTQSAGSHAHTVSGTTSDVSGNHTHAIPSAGGGLAHENRPPYYALAYIMKT